MCELNKGSNERYYGMWDLHNEGWAKNVRLLRVDPAKREEVNTGDINLMHVKKDGVRRKIMWKLYPDVSGNSAGSPSASGSAFFVTAKGHIVTNYHVVGGCNDKSKIMYNDKEYSAKLLASDKKLDLALLKVDLKNKGYLKFAYDPKKMQKIYAAGYPLGKFLSDDLKFTDGIISSLKGFDDNTNQIQISAAINLGNSGGPVINQSGELVGVAVSGLDKGVTEGINFAIKSESVKTFLTSNKVKPSTNFYSRELKNDKLLTILEQATIYTFCN